MQRKKIILIAVAILAVVALAAAAYYLYNWYTVTRTIPTEAAQIRMTVTSLGDELQRVPLVAPPQIVAFAMDKYYSQYVHPDLLAKWKADPLNALGRTEEHTVPNSIQIESIKKNADQTYTAEAFEVMNTDAPKNTVTKSLIKISFTLTRGPDGWQITEYHKMK